MNSTTGNIAIEPYPDTPAAFAGSLIAITELKDRLQEHYERIHPGQSELLRNAIAEAEAMAWELSFFPHLFLPDLVEARIAELASQPAFAQQEAALSLAA